MSLKSEPQRTSPQLGLSQIYAREVARGALQHDLAQSRAVDTLERLAERLEARSIDVQNAKGFLRRLKKSAPTAIEGVYLVGAVGRGKSMLMDMFFRAARVDKKRRVHFHAFMQETHRSLHQLRNQSKRPVDPIGTLADRLVQEVDLLCFDEFQLTDMSDAVMVLRLLNMLMERGVVIVATSNTAPEDLLRGHVGRVSVLPYIDAFARHMNVIVLQAARDYRRDRDLVDDAWLVCAPVDADAAGEIRAALDAIFLRYATSSGSPTHVCVGTRHLKVPSAAGPVARFGFADICGQPYGPADYLALAERFPVILIDDIPRLGPERFDEARRFITLVDILYERRTRLFASAACVPEEIYQDGENARAFERTISRLEEMRSQNWADAAF